MARVDQSRRVVSIALRCREATCRRAYRAELALPGLNGERSHDSRMHGGKDGSDGGAAGGPGERKALARSAVCPGCGRAVELSLDAAMAEQGRVTRCAACDGVEFFVRKDFPQKLGLALVVVFGLIATVFYSYKMVPAAFATLAALVVIDAIIYLFVGRVTVCYRCRAEYRGVAYDPNVEGFDLATSEKYDVAG